MNRRRLSVCLSIRWIQNYGRTKHHQFARVNGIVMHDLVCTSVAYCGRENACRSDRTSSVEFPFSLLESGVFTYIQGVPLATEPGHFFNNSNTDEDIATKFEQEYVRCVRNEMECVCSAPNC